MSWNETLQDYSTRLNSIAEWASIVNLGNVRDYCRLAKSELEKEQKRIQENSLESEKLDLIRLVEWYKSQYHKGNSDIHDDMIENIKKVENPAALEIYRKVVDGWLDN